MHIEIGSPTFERTFAHIEIAPPRLSDKGERKKAWYVLKEWYEGKR